MSGIPWREYVRAEQRGHACLLSHFSDIECGDLVIITRADLNRYRQALSAHLFDINPTRSGSSNRRAASLRVTFYRAPMLISIIAAPAGLHARQLEHRIWFLRKFVPKTDLPPLHPAPNNAPCDGLKIRPLALTNSVGANRTMLKCY